MLEKLLTSLEHILFFIAPELVQLYVFKGLSRQLFYLRQLHFNLVGNPQAQILPLLNFGLYLALKLPQALPGLLVFPLDTSLLLLEVLSLVAQQLFFQHELLCSLLLIDKAATFKSSTPHCRRC